MNYLTDACCDAQRTTHLNIRCRMTGLPVTYNRSCAQWSYSTEKCFWPPVLGAFFCSWFAHRSEWIYYRGVLQAHACLVCSSHTWKSWENKKVQTPSSAGWMSAVFSVCYRNSKVKFYHFVEMVGTSIVRGLMKKSRQNSSPYLAGIWFFFDELQNSHISLAQSPCLTELRNGKYHIARD